MQKEVVNIPGIETPDLPFNHVVKAGNLLFLSSQLSCDLKTGEFLSGDIGKQTKQTMENIKLLLKSCGSSMNNILKTIIYMRNVEDFDKINDVYKQYFTKGSEPARVAMQVPSPLKEIDIEIEVTALIEK